jgi:predicted  nucleic acid-binding Zn-ribbon protein
MRIRHRVPSIFNLSMVDVLCCALGCVILLWLLNMRDARQRAEQAGQTDQRLAAALTERDLLRRQLADAGTQLADMAALARSLQAQLTASGQQLADTQKRFTAAEEQARLQIADLGKLLASLRTEKKDVEERLARQTMSAGELDKKLLAAVQRVAALETEVSDKDNLAEVSGKRIVSLAGKLRDAEAQLRKLQGQAELVPDLQTDLKSTREKLAAEEALAKALEKEINLRVRELEQRDKDMVRAKEEHARLVAAEERLAGLAKDLTDATSRIEGLQNDKRAMRLDAERLRASVENRFAGIALTGKRVVFLVDMSGSMELVDEHTEAPNKWVGVRETLAKVLRSLPEVEKFQVILFAEQTSFPLGREGSWLDYDPKSSADRVLQTLSNIKPKGNTNMYTALEAAFRYRAQGLDTIYLLSDGLPNLGEGLTPQQAKTLSETQKGEILGKVIRTALKANWNRPSQDRPQVRINTIGFFYESPDVGAFLWALAREHDGSFVGMSRP